MTRRSTEHLLFVFIIVILTGCRTSSVKTEPADSGISYIGVLFSNHPSGVRIVNIYPGSPAQKAGFKNGEVITHVDNVPVAGEFSLRRIIRQTKPGSYIKIRILNPESGSTERTVKTEALPNDPLEFPTSDYPAFGNGSEPVIPYK
jgi:S1-C subfamily serine protease